MQLVAVTRCPSVVIFILLHRRPSRLTGIQYGRSAFISVSSWVNIPVGAFSRGLPIILIFHPNLECFRCDLGCCEISVIISWELSQLSLIMPFGDCLSRHRSVEHLVCSESIFGVIRQCFSRHTCTHSA